MALTAVCASGGFVSSMLVSGNFAILFARSRANSQVTMEVEQNGGSRKSSYYKYAQIVYFGLRVLISARSSSRRLRS